MPEDGLVKIDAKDRKLLYQLDLDSGQTLSQLGRKVGLSKQVVDYRLKSLVEKKIISSFYTVINFPKLGYAHYKLYFKFQNADPDKEKVMVGYWTDSKNSIWVASCRGRWDLAVSLLAGDVNELGGIISNFLDKYAPLVLEKNILITQSSSVFTKTYLADDEEKREFVYGGKIEHYQLDETERKVLSLLSANARMPVLDLMEKTGLTRDVISYRLKKLKRDGIIVQYRIHTNLEKMQHILYKIILRLQGLSGQKETELKSFVRHSRNGVQFLKLLGSWDAELEFEVMDEEQLHEILLELRNRFSHLIRNYDILRVHREYKLDYFPF